MLFAGLVLSLGLSGWPNAFLGGETNQDVEAAVSIALDADAPYQDRLSAIQEAYYRQAIATRRLGFNGSQSAEILRLAPLARHRDPLLREYALIALSADGHFEFIHDHAETCPTVEFFDADRFTELCIRPVVIAYGNNTLNQNDLWSFVQRLSLDQQTMALRILMDLEADHTPFVLLGLSEQFWVSDWRLAYEAAVLATYSNSQNIADVIDGLERVRDQHWLSSVREQAGFSLHFLSTGSVEDSGYAWVDSQLAQLEARDDGTRTLNRKPERLLYSTRLEARSLPFHDCEGHTWQFGRFNFPVERALEPSETRSTSLLHTPMHTLVGFNVGEWKGSLVIQSQGPDTQFIPSGNVHDLALFQDEIYVATSLQYEFGALQRVSLHDLRSPNVLDPVVALPAPPHFIHALDTQRLAIGTTRWALVYNVIEHQIEGVADCISAP